MFREDVRFPTVLNLDLSVEEEWRITTAPLKHPFVAWREKDSQQAGS
jgi:hypothetical protein